MSATHLFIAAFVLAFVVSLALAPVAIWLAPKIGAVDIPKDERRMHTKPMPRFGGFGIFFGVMVSVIFTHVLILGNGAASVGIVPTHVKGVLIGGVIIYIIGVYDDLKGLPAKVKFLLQIACAIVVWSFGVRITFFTIPFAGDIGYTNEVASFIFTVIWIVGITNTINLIDGLDGLAAGIAAIASLSIAFTAVTTTPVMYAVILIMLAIAGGAAGFLPFNFHPAKIFMGDAGSLFLGFMLASASVVGPVKGATVIAVIVPVLVLGVPIFDTAFAIFRRIASGRSIMEADKGHLHHRLMAAGMGQTRSVLTLYGISGIMGVAAVVFCKDMFAEAAALFIIAATFIYIFLTDANTSFNLRGINVARAERRERRREKREAKRLTKGK